MTLDQAEAALRHWAQFGLTRHRAIGLLPRIWELRHNLTPFDAGYVALAEMLDCPLVTSDGRMARTPGLRCDVQLLSGV